MMQEQRVFRSIIVVKNNITPFARTAIKEMAMRNYRMEYFRDAELLVSVVLNFGLQDVRHATHCVWIMCPLHLYIR